MATNPTRIRTPCRSSARRRSRPSLSRPARRLHRAASRLPLASRVPSLQRQAALYAAGPSTSNSRRHPELTKITWPLRSIQSRTKCSHRTIMQQRRQRMARLPSAAAIIPRRTTGTSTGHRALARAAPRCPSRRTGRLRTSTPPLQRLLGVPRTRCRPTSRWSARSARTTKSTRRGHISSTLRRHRTTTTQRRRSTSEEQPDILKLITRLGFTHRRACSPTRPVDTTSTSADPLLNTST